MVGIISCQMKNGNFALHFCKYKGYVKGNIVNLGHFGIIIIMYLQVKKDCGSYSYIAVKDEKVDTCTFLKMISEPLQSKMSRLALVVF